MTTKTLTRALAISDRAGLFAALLAGLALIYFAGISQAAVVHDAAHDQRHSLAFPCH